MSSTRTRRKSTTASRKRTSTASSSSSGSSGSGNAAKHLAAALQLIADRVVFVSEVDQIAFQDHLTLATGGENKDQLAAAKERHEVREAARKEAAGE